VCIIMLARLKINFSRKFAMNISINVGAQSHIAENACLAEIIPLKFIYGTYCVSLKAQKYTYMI